MPNETVNADRRTLLGLGAAAGAVAAVLPFSGIGTNAAFAAAPGAGAPPRTTLTPDQALARLTAGNQRFVAGARRPINLATARAAVANGQAPFAALIACADSRVSPELLFDEGIGDIFVVRTAGNYLDDAGFGSIAYGVAALGVSLIAVCGHERCGAVGAAAKLVTDNAQQPPALEKMLRPIIPAVVDARASLPTPDADLVDHAVHTNVRHVVAGLRTTRDPLLSDALGAGKLKVVGAYYDMDSGKVDFFDRG